MESYPKKVNSRDIARLAGVSQATVSRVLTGHPSVKPATKARVLAVIENNNYQPNAIARAMKTQLSGAIGVVVSRVTNPVVPEILLRLGHELAACGRQMVVWNTDTEGEQSVVKAIRQSLVDGLIFTAATTGSEALQAALQHRISTVLINRTLPDAACDQVASHNHSGAAMLARYLVSHGRTRVALVNGPLNRSTLCERETGLREGLAQAGLEIAPDRYFSAPFSHAVFRQAAMQLMANPQPPDVICCGNDVIAFGVLCGLKARAYKVPGDIWVTGFDGIEMAGWDLFDLTTVSQPLDMMVTTAIKQLLARINGQRQSHATTRYETELIIRSTTAHQPLIRS